MDDKTCHSFYNLMLASVGYVALKAVAMAFHVHSVVFHVTLGAQVSIPYIRWGRSLQCAYLLYAIALVFWIIASGTLTSLSSLQLCPFLDFVFIVLLILVGVHSQTWRSELTKVKMMHALLFEKNV